MRRSPIKDGSVNFGRALLLACPSSRQADRLGQLTVSIARAVGDEDKLFGSVTSRDIAEALAEQKSTIDTKKIHLDDPIKALGMTEVPIKLGQGVTAKIRVWVVEGSRRGAHIARSYGAFDGSAVPGLRARVQ